MVADPGLDWKEELVEDTAGQPVPLACNLDSEALSDRRRLWESIADLVEEREVIAEGFCVSWRATERVKELLPPLVATEATAAPSRPGRFAKRLEASCST